MILLTNYCEEVGDVGESEAGIGRVCAQLQEVDISVTVNFKEWD